MSIAVRAEREGDRARIVPVGAFDLAHAPAVATAVAHVPPDLEGCRSIDVDLTHLDRIDGAGAVLLARFLDRLDADGDRTRMVEDRNPEAARLITLYRQKRAEPPPARTRAMSALTKIGAVAADLPARVTDTLDFTGRCAAALPKTVASPRSVDWRSLPRPGPADRRRRPAGDERGQPARRRHHRVSGRLATGPLRRRRRMFPSSSSSHTSVSSGRWSPRSWSPADRAPVSPRRLPR